MSIALALFAVSSITGMVEAKNNRERAKRTNDFNYKVTRLNNTLAYNRTIKEQTEDFKNFMENQAQITGAQKVTLYQGGVSKKSSVFAGVEHENKSDYYEAIQRYKDNLEDAKNNLERANTDAKIGFVNANASASAKYNGFNDILNSALNFYNYSQVTGDTSKVNGLLGEVNKKIDSAKKISTSLLGG